MANANDRTVAFYDADPESYSRGTLDNDLSDLYPGLLKHVRPGGLVLDAGSGSGRDIREFLSRGYRVEAFDASVGMAGLASRLTGVDVKVARFEEWSSPAGCYDGIWCFASLLHVAHEDLPGVVSKLAKALRPDAPLFASFKRGDGETVDERGRHYTNLTVDTARRLFASVPGLAVERVWQDDGPTGLGGRTSWVYVLAVRTG
ncbi:class I SAM-dependent methyltransferase [Sphingomonas faeni]